MSTNIGKTSAIVSASSGEFTSAFKQCEAGLGDFVKTVAKTNAALEALQHQEDAAAEHGHGFLKGLLEFEALRAGFEIAKELTVELVKGSFEAIDALDKLSSKTGISADELSRLQYAAGVSGVSVETLSGALIKMTKNLYEAGQGGGQEVQKALADIGLSAKDLASLQPEEQFAKIAGAIGEVGNAGKANAAAMAIFGKSGAELRPLFAEGAEGIEELLQRSDKLGLTISAIDAKNVAQAHDAIEDAWKVVVGLANAVAVDLAPYVKAVADHFVRWSTEGGEGVKAVGAGVEYVAEGLAFAADAGNGFLGVVQGVRGAMEYLGAEILNEIANVAATAETLYNKITGSHSEWSSTIRQMATDAAEDSTKAFAAAGQDFEDAYSGKASKAVQDFFADAKSAAESTKVAVHEVVDELDEVGEASKGAQKVAEELAKLKQAVDDFGLTEGQKKIGDLFNNPDATQEDIDAAIALEGQLDGLKEAKKAHEDAQKAADEYYKSTITPAEKYAGEVERINKLLAEGFLDAETAARAQEKAADELAKTEAGSGQKSSKGEGPKLLEAGSQAAATFIAQIQRAQRSGNGPAEAALKKQDQQIGLTVEVRDAVKTTNGIFAKLGSI